MTLYEISKAKDITRNFYIYLGDFLDNFKIINNEKRYKLIVDKPITNNSSDFYLPFLAAVAHKLANDYELEVPNWVFDPDCYLKGDNPYFTGNVKGDLRLLFMYISPPEFKHRNLFVDENVLERV